MSALLKTVLFLILCITFSSAINLEATISQSETTKSYKFTCPTGYVLRGRKDWTDQQPSGTQFFGFTCCPESHPDLHYLNENYFCCPTGTGGYCMSNMCNCNSRSVPLKSGIYPEFTKLS